MTDIHIGAKVALDAGYSEVYKSAPTGAQASVRDKTVDEDGFELIFVKWDREDEKHDEQDGWTFANHFILLENDIKLITRVETEDEREIKRLEREKEFVESLGVAFDTAVTAHAFFMIAVKEDDSEMGMSPYMFANTQSESAGLLMESFIIQLAAESQSAAAQRVLDYLRGKDA